MPTGDQRADPSSSELYHRLVDEINHVEGFLHAVVGVDQRIGDVLMAEDLLDALKGSTLATHLSSEGVTEIVGAGMGCDLCPLDAGRHDAGHLSAPGQP